MFHGHVNFLCAFFYDPIICVIILLFCIHCTLPSIMFTFNHLVFL